MSNEGEHGDISSALAAIRSQAAAGNLHITQHAASEMFTRRISLSDVVAVVCSGEILENYPEHQRGPCCLINGSSEDGRAIHIVCTSSQPTLIIITAYEPQMPKWKSSRKRNR